MASFAEIAKQSDITTCPTCAELFVNPKILPCVHTICLNCLQARSQNKDPGSDVPCPLCSKSFIIPCGGCAMLPQNHFIETLLLRDKVSQMKLKQVPCDICKDNMNKAPEAVAYCKECLQNICETCSKCHLKLKATTSHEVVSLKEKSKLLEKVSKTSEMYCENHPAELLMPSYCMTCKVMMCDVCSVDVHKDHLCSTLEQSAVMIRAEIKEHIKKVSDCIAQSHDIIQQLKAKQQTFLDSTAGIGAEIEKLRETMKPNDHFDDHQKSLLDELNSIERIRAKDTDAVINGIERHVTALKDFQKHCEAVQCHGTEVDILLSAGYIYNTGLELTNNYEAEATRSVFDAQLTFIPTVSKVDGTVNPIGRIDYNEHSESNDTTGKDEKKSVGGYSKWWWGAGAILGGGAAVAAAPLVLTAVGFGAGGVIAGSIAAGIQSSIGSVAAGSAFALLQSAGAAGIGLGANVALGAAGAAAGVGAAAAVKKATEGSQGRDCNENDAGRGESDATKDGSK